MDRAIECRLSFRHRGIFGIDIEPVSPLPFRANDFKASVVSSYRINVGFAGGYDLVEGPSIALCGVRIGWGTETGDFA